MSNQADLEAKTQQDSEAVNITHSGEEILVQLGIDSTTVKAMKRGMKQSDYRAVINWLTKYKTNSEASNLEKVKGLLKAFYPLCKVEDWERGNKVLLIHLNTPSNEELGIQLGIWGYYQTQIEMYSQVFGKLGNRVNAVCLKFLGIAHRWLSDFGKAYHYLDKALALFEKLGDEEKKAEVLHELGLLQADQGKGSMALQYYNLALHLFKKRSNFSGIASVLNEKARVMNDQNNYIESEKLYQDLENIYDTYLTKEKKHFRYAWILYDRGRNLADQCKNLEACEYTQKALELFQQLNYQSGIAWYLYSLSILMLNLQQNLLAYTYSRQALNLFRDLRDKSGIPWSLHILGRVAFRQKNYRLVHDCYQENIKIWHDAQNFSGIAFALEGFAHLASALD